LSSRKKKGEIQTNIHSDELRRGKGTQELSITAFKKSSREEEGKREKISVRVGGDPFDS